MTTETNPTNPFGNTPPPSTRGATIATDTAFQQDTPLTSRRGAMVTTDSEFQQDTPRPSIRTSSTPKTVRPPPPHIEHRRRVLSFKVAIATLCIFGTSLFAITLMTLNIYYPIFLPVFFAAMGIVSLLSFTAFVIAVVKFVHGWLNRAQTSKQ